MKFTTKMFAGVALALSTSLAFAGPIINASRLGTWTTYHTTSGAGGGVTKWRINNYDSLTGTDFEWLDQQFYSMCIEPVETLSNGDFELVDLEDAPTNPGGMGTNKANAIERLIGSAEWVSFGDLLSDKAMSTAMGMILWESSQEGNGPYDRSDGSYTISSNNAESEVNAAFLEGLMNGGLLMVDAFGMIAINSTGDTRYRQDFMFFNPASNRIFIDTVPVPAPMALLGLGLVGMMGVRKFRSK